MPSKARQKSPRIDPETFNDFFQSIERIFARIMPPALGGASSELSVTPLEGRAMLFIARHNQCLMSEFSRGVAVPLSTATRLVDRLVVKGLLVRERSDEDRRVVRVALSEQGRQLERHASEHTRKTIDTMLAKLTHQQQKQLVDLLRVLSAS